MIQKIKSSIIILASLFSLALPALVPAVASADVTPKDLSKGLCSGSNFDVNGGTSSTDCTDDSASGDKVNTLLKRIVNIASAIVGVIAVVMIIVGGLRYITSGGDTNKVSAAKNTLLYAIIGLVIVALAQIVVHFVLSQSASITS